MIKDAGGVTLSTTSDSRFRILLPKGMDLRFEKKWMVAVLWLAELRRCPNVRPFSAISLKGAFHRRPRRATRQHIKQDC